MNLRAEREKSQKGYEIINLLFPPFSFDLFANEAKSRKRKETKEDMK